MSTTPQVRLVGIIAAALTTVPVVLLASRFLETVAEFEALFQGFGADLPGLTRFILSHPLAVAVVFRLCVATQVVLLILLVVKRTFAARRAFWLLAVVTLSTTLLLIAAFYLPIFRLGSVV